MGSKHDTTLPCPCLSGKQYGMCCRPFHLGQKPKTALQLMRSRYSAYALCIPDYIIQTTHPACPEFRKRSSEEWMQKISEFSLNTEFKDLEILEFQENGLFATVTFFARLMQGQKDVSFTEKSLFEKVDGKWLYRSGQMS